MNLPPDTTLQADVSAGDWIKARVLPWGSAYGTRMCSVAPTGFEVYVRVFHHLDEPVGDSRVGIRWAEVAERTGRIMHPTVQFTRFGWPEDPHRGILAPQEAAALVGVLRRYTATPEDCWHGIWHGYGSLAGSVSVLTLRRPRRRLGNRKRRSTRLDQPLDLTGAPTLSLPGREYYLFRGPIDAAHQFEFSGFRQTPNLWWPQDKAWFVASEIDLDSTVVACSRACAEALLDGDLEALEVAPEDRLDIAGDTINPRVPT